MKNRQIIAASIMIAMLMIAGAHALSERTLAASVSPSPSVSTTGTGTGTNQNSQTGDATCADGFCKFAGKMTIKKICCNGLEYKIDESVSNGVTGTFIFPWQNFIPLYEVGIGLYKYWLLMDGKTVAGDSTKSGQCITIESYCENEESVDYTTRKMGVILCGDGRPQSGNFQSINNVGSGTSGSGCTDFSSISNTGTSAAGSGNFQNINNVGK